MCVQPKFYDGAKVILFSKEFKKAIRLMPNGDVNCLGGHGMKGDIAVACGSYIK